MRTDNCTCGKARCVLHRKRASDAWPASGAASQLPSDFYMRTFDGVLYELPPSTSCTSSGSKSLLLAADCSSTKSFQVTLSSLQRVRERRADCASRTFSPRGDSESCYINAH